MNRTWRVGILLVALALFGLAVGAISASRPTAAAPPSSRLLVFEDRDTGLRLSIEADPTAQAAGMFSFFAPSRGTYVSVVAAALKVESPESTNVTFLGDVDLISGQGGRVRLAARLQAHLDPMHHTAEATLTTDTDRLHLVAKTVSRAGFENTLRAFEGAMVVGDWGALYDLSSSDYTQNLTRDAFIALARSQTPPAGTVTALRRLKMGEVRTSPLGFSFVVVPYEATRSVGGATRTSTENVYFLFEGNSWRLWFGITQ